MKFSTQKPECKHHPDSLLPGSYTFLVSYEKDLPANPPLSGTIPSNGGGNFGEWCGGADREGWRNIRKTAQN